MELTDAILNILPRHLGLSVKQGFCCWPALSPRLILRPMRISRKALCFFFLAVFVHAPCLTAQSLDDLQRQLEKILNDTRTPSASVAIVHRDGPEYVAGLGSANPETLFRIGSVSKGFVSLAVLHLVDQGKISLNDSIRTLAPEVWFENPWEKTDPVRVVHLLEHTTGWDDIHLREYAKDARDMRLRDALDFDHHSRVSRWRPGTRVAYSNSGPAVAAYIVEKITGQRFEDFVEQNLFRPIGMKTATYFQPAVGAMPSPYWHMLFRPSGAINASANDMAKYVQFHLNRGAVDRVEVPSSSWAARAGLRTVHALGNVAVVEDGFVYHGHDGAVIGGLAQMWYMPEYDVGYFYAINSENEAASELMGLAIRAYITRNLQKPPLPPVQQLSSEANAYAGWYEPASPQLELTHFLDRFTGLTRISFRDGNLIFDSRDRSDWSFVPVSDTLFRFVPRTYPADPIPTLALLPPTDEGLFLQFRTNTLKRVPGWLVILQAVLVVYVLAASLSILIYAPFWAPFWIWRRPAERGIRLFPLLSVLSLLAGLGIVGLASDDPLSKLAHVTGWSVTLYLSTILFAATALASAITCWRRRHSDVRPAVFRYSVAVSVALLIAVAYLTYWGVIGIRTWV
jgi:CubicO group peptidase (beta-lactamase class C family)